MTIARRRYVFHGTVQGVGFRFAAERAARRLSVTGFVRNRPDGTVELVAEADSGRLDTLLESLRTAFRVTRVESESVEANAPLEGFHVRP